jgi:NADH dehydrogenase FAD-containing subunit
MPTSATTEQQVVIVGGGYAGTALARQLDSHARVTLVEKKERFFHNVGALRAVVDPSWQPKIFIPYDGLLQRGRVLHDTVLEASSTSLRLASGEQLTFDYLVLATGSSYPFPAKTPYDDVAQSSRVLTQASERIRAAQHILLIGAGPVGIEFAGEIVTRFPSKQVTLIDPAPSLLGRFKPQLGVQLLKELQQRGVRVILGEQLQSLPAALDPDALDVPLPSATFVTDKGTVIEADLAFICFGAQPNSAYLGSDLAASRDAHGRLKVNQFLQVEGQRHIFAIGDVTNIQEPKLAVGAGLHAGIVAENIRRLIAHKGTTAPALKAYQPLTASVLIVPVGPDGGAGQLPLFGGLVVGRFLTSQIKGKSLLVERYWKALNASLEAQGDTVTQ